MKKVLMIAYHFPPFKGSSGVERAHKFSTYLPANEWQPIVLSVNPRVYEYTDKDLLDKVSKDVIARRTFALDIARDLSISGRYFSWMALPDRWASWTLSAIPAGLDLIKKHKPDVIWSTYPIATAHLIGWVLHSITKISWIADFRDPMTEGNYPANPLVRRIYRWIEKKTVKSASAVTFTTRGLLNAYAKRYPEIPAERWKLIPNGYDEEDFITAERGLNRKAFEQRPTTLLHSGFLYLNERDPSAFFAALGELRRTGKISPSDLKVVLRASGNEKEYRARIQDEGLDGIVLFEPLIARSEALREMLTVDGLLILQGSSCNHQIPAKLYECLRAQRPIFAMTDPEGDTAAMLREAGADMLVPLDSKQKIMDGLLDFLKQVREGTAQVASDKSIASYTRQAATAEFARVLDEVSGNNAASSKKETKLLVTVDVEEDWQGPGEAPEPTLKNIGQIPGLQRIFKAFKVRPVYLVDYPVAVDSKSIAILKGIFDEGRCEIGTHLHSWFVSPVEQKDIFNKVFQYKLPRHIEKQKIEAMTKIMEENFKIKPITFRAGRWGADGETIQLLSELGYKIDVSVLPLVDASGEGGMNFMNAPFEPYYPDPDDITKTAQTTSCNVLEIPVTNGFSGRDFERLRAVHERMLSLPRWLHINGLLDKLGVIKRISLCPERDDFQEMKTLVDRCLERGHEVLHLTFHSSMIATGTSPYARTDRERDLRLENLRKILDYIVKEKGIESVTAEEFYKQFRGRE